jgi:hypothetical protein
MSTNPQRPAPALEPSALSPEGSTVSTAPILPNRPFTEDDLQLVATFCCCEDPNNEKRWEKDVNHWIKAPVGGNGAVDAIRLGRTHVWLYHDQRNRLIGYGSLGVEDVALSDESKVQLWGIPCFGIQTEFQRHPEGSNKEARFGRRIFRGLIAEAQRRNIPNLFLYVDPENKKAKDGFYPIFGFTKFADIVEDGREWVLMHRSLLRK